MASSPLSLLLLLLSFSLTLLSLSSSSPISLPLRHLLPPKPPSPASPDRYQYHHLAALASASLLRARHLKRSPSSSASPQDDRHSDAPNVPIPLSPHSYGGYSVSLSFGTPPQTIPLVFDTGSDLVWIPCTRSYDCRNCSSFPNQSASPVFLPKLSSSSRIVGCRNPKCRWIHSQRTLSSCLRCNSSSSPDCPQICPPYAVLYGSGSTGGVLLSETLAAPGGLSVPGFAVGCSVLSTRQPPAGIAGFGRGNASLPSQLRLPRFSYCLVSRRYDDIPAKVGTVLLGGPPESSRNDNTSSTPFLTNPAAKPGSPFAVYYYVGLRRIVVGGKKVKIPDALLSIGPDGDGGVIVDSGSTFTFMEAEILDLVVGAMVEAVGGRYNRSADAEGRTGLRLCFAMLEGEGDDDVTLPTLELHFKGGASMDLSVENYFAVVGETGEVCLTVVTDDGGKEAAAGGPSVILGAFQQQNHHMVFDLERGKLGFRKERCLRT